MTREYPGFDIEAAKRVADDYTRSTGVRCAIIDGTGNRLHPVSGIDDDPCEFCRTFRRALGTEDTTEKSHLYGAYQAERFGGSYIFFCPSSFTHWTTPIVVDGIMRGAFVGGPVLSITTQEYFTEEVASRVRTGAFTRNRATEIRRRLASIPYADPIRIRSLAELLLIVGAYVSRGDEIADRRENLERESRISEFVQELKDSEYTPLEHLPYPVEKERELLAGIRAGRPDRAQKALNEILGHIFFAGGRNMDLVRQRVKELVVLLSRAALEGGADVEEVFGLNYRYLEKLDEQKDLNDLAHWMARILRRFSDCMFLLKEVKHVDAMRKSTEYIKHRMSEKVTLDAVARHVNLSSPYFSRIFKDEMKMSFVTYLNTARVERSKELLRATDLRLAEIAALAGFEDQSYFTKVFKRTTGTSPGRYRETGGRS
ncbi:MAG: helix-turn-helix domain-containing protein [Spirochaetaceae bacterium]|nr:MAG: helix-turn-helix domain-containing protein [Spirochaetaceae bacterium]